jgi:N utilization substance protein A
LEGDEMNGELLAVMEYLERERGISRDVLIEAVSSSVISAARKSAGQVKNLKVEIDRETGNISAYSELRIVEDVQTPDEEILLADARKIEPKAVAGGTVRKPIAARNFGRIAAQTAKQVIIQRIKEAEHEIIFNEYKDRIGEIVTAVVRKHERGNVILDLGRAEAVLPQKEQSPREGYGTGRRFKVYIMDVKDSPRGPEVVVSRTHPMLLRKLFELEVPEIAEGSVEIKAVARDPGFRSKIAVTSKNDKIDAVGACVGMRGARVKDVVHELNGEKVDIVRWNEDMASYITNALSPAKLSQIKMVDEKTAMVIVDDSQFSLAVGRRGQSARLVAKLTGCRIEIKKLSEVGREEKEAKVALSDVKDLIKGRALTLLLKHGYNTVGRVRKASAEELLKIPGLGAKTVEKIRTAVAEFRLEEKRGEKEEIPPSARPAKGGGAVEKEGVKEETPPADEEKEEKKNEKPVEESRPEEKVPSAAAEKGEEEKHPKETAEGAGEPPVEKGENEAGGT